MRTVRQAESTDGRTQASSVIALVRSRLLASGTLTWSLTPSKDSAEPNLPVSERVGPLIVPTLPVPEASVAVVPVVSSKPNAATRPVEALLTLTVTVLDVVVCPSLSSATAVRLWAPLVAAVVFHVAEYGLVVSAAPRLVPSTRNCTLVTPRSSPALALIATVAPDTVAPAAGAVIETVGGLPLSTVTATALEVVVLPSLSRATAVTLWVPAEAGSVFHVA